MSVRSRVDKFEALSQQEAKKHQRDNNETRKRFHFPSKNTTKNPDSEAGNNFILSNKASQGIQDFDVDLQQVWSVRKNIPHKGGPQASHHYTHHQGQVNSTTTTTSSLANQNISTPVQYSKHGAIPTLPADTNIVQSPVKKQQLLSKGYDRLQLREPKRNPLQDNNHASPWSVKMEAHSYNSPGAIVSTLPIEGNASIPSPKYRTNFGGMEVARPMGEHQPTTGANGVPKRPMVSTLPSEGNASIPSPKYRTNLGGMEEARQMGEHQPTTGANGLPKRPMVSTLPSEGNASIPSPKRRTNLGGMEVARPMEERQPCTFTNIKELPKGKTYAKRMAQGYMKSMGVGEYSPKTSFQRKPEPSKRAILTDNQVRNRQKKMEDQDSEFDFDI